MKPGEVVGWGLVILGVFIGVSQLFVPGGLPGFNSLPTIPINGNQYMASDFVGLAIVVVGVLLRDYSDG